jgi:hypothetical protein
VRYLGGIFDKKIAWGLHAGMMEAKALRIFIIIYSLFRSERLSANIKLKLYKVLTSAFNAWEFSADIYYFKLHRLQNKAGLCGSVVGRGTIIQAGRSRVRFAMSLDFQLTYYSV